MTPNDLEFLIHCHVSPDEHPRFGSPAIVQALVQFQSAGIVEDAGQDDNTYNLTARGQFWLAMILATPMPVMRWVDPREATS